eukprot:scaffold562821_cov19-Prasinocladus_malaysianus.AAC.1
MLSGCSRSEGFSPCKLPCQTESDTERGHPLRAQAGESPDQQLLNSRKKKVATEYANNNAQPNGS